MRPLWASASAPDRLLRGLAARNLAAFSDDDLNALLRLDGNDEAVLHLTMLGRGGGELVFYGRQRASVTVMSRRAPRRAPTRLTG